MSTLMPGMMVCSAKHCGDGSGGVRAAGGEGGWEGLPILVRGLQLPGVPHLSGLLLLKRWLKLKLELAGWLAGMKRGGPPPRLTFCFSASTMLWPLRVFWYRVSSNMMAPAGQQQQQPRLSGSSR